MQITNLKLIFNINKNAFNQGLDVSPKKPKRNPNGGSALLPPIFQTQENNLYPKSLSKIPGNYHSQPNLHNYNREDILKKRI